MSSFFPNARVWLRPLAVAVPLSLVAPACGDGGPSAMEKAMMAPDAKKEDAKKDDAAKKKAAAPAKTPEELAAARRAAGFKTREEIAAENAAMFEKGAREYVKTRAKAYKKLLADLEKSLAKVEKAAGKWKGSKDPQASFERWRKGYRDEVKALTKRYDELTERGAKGGNTQAEFGKAFRTWESLNNDLGPEIAGNERFAATLEEIRGGLAKVRTMVEEIEKDESLEVNKFRAEDGKK